MDAPPARSLRERPHGRLIGSVAAAALVAIAFLPGTIVQGVLASGITPAPMEAGNPQVKADPTPTPTGTPTPTPTPEATPTPTPTPEATPTPTPTPEATPTPTPRADSLVKVLKYAEDGEVFGDWRFNLHPDATIIESNPVTGLFESEFAWFTLDLSAKPLRRLPKNFELVGS